MSHRHATFPSLARYTASVLGLGTGVFALFTSLRLHHIESRSWMTGWAGLEVHTVYLTDVFISFWTVPALDIDNDTYTLNSGFLVLPRNL